jgi:O-antigen/teichoic acid export membrane protein
MTNLPRSALVGVTSNFAGSAALVVAQLASTAATARLVAPREFGVYAVAQAGAGLAGYFTMNALGNGLLRRSRLGPKTIGTATILSLASALAVTIIILIAAAIWANAWRVPAAASVIRVLAITGFLTSAATVPVALMRRRLRFAAAAIVETGSVVIGLSAGVALAFDLHSALALAAGQAVGAAALLVGAGIMTVDELQVGFDRHDARELFTFAGQVNGLGFTNYVANTAPSWFAARAFGPYVLGIYSRGSLMVALPLTYLSSSVMKVLYPLYGRVRDDLRRTKVLLDEGLTLTTGLVWPAFALVAGASPVIVRILLGARWHGAAPLVALCALAACADLPCGLLTNAAEAFGWMRLIMVRQLAFLIAVAATLFTAYLAHLSLRWLLVGIAVSQWTAYALTLRAFVHRGFLHTGSVLRSQASQGAVAVGAFGAAAACAQILNGAGLLAQAVGQVAIGTGLVGAILLGRSRFPATKILARRMRAASDQDIVRARVAAL